MTFLQWTRGSGSLFLYSTCLTEAARPALEPRKPQIVKKSKGLYFTRRRAHSGQCEEDLAKPDPSCCLWECFFTSRDEPATTATLLPWRPRTTLDDLSLVATVENNFAILLVTSFGQCTLSPPSLETRKLLMSKFRAAHVQIPRGAFRSFQQQKYYHKARIRPKSANRIEHKDKKANRYIEFTGLWTIIYPTEAEESHK